jgi:hypothetical protein
MPRILDELNQVRSEVISRGEQLVFKLSSCLLIVCQTPQNERKCWLRAAHPDAEVTQSHSESWTVSVRVY